MRNKIILFSDKHPLIESGIKEMRVLKTTQSSFTNFVTDEYRSLPDAHDRVFSTKVKASWTYMTKNADFDKCWDRIKDIIMENFAGDPRVGIHSPSVQNTLYKAAQQVLDTIPEVIKIN